MATNFEQVCHFLVIFASNYQAMWQSRDNHMSQQVSENQSQVLTFYQCLTSVFRQHPS